MGEYNPIGFGNQMYIDSVFREELETTGRWVQISCLKPKEPVRDLKSERQVVADIKKGIKLCR